MVAIATIVPIILEYSQFKVTVRYTQCYLQYYNSKIITNRLRMTFVVWWADMLTINIHNKNYGEVWRYV